MHKEKNLFFISRTYPPTIGGIENQNKAVCDKLSELMEVSALVNKYGKKALPYFIPWSMFISLVFNKHRITLLGDGVLAIIPWLVKKVKPKKKFICIVHGLDITYSSALYQKFWVNIFFSNVDCFIAVSHNTKEILIKKGIDKNKITVIPNGYDFSSANVRVDKHKINSLLHLNTEKKILCLTLARLVKRKGVEWFISNVVSDLPDSTLYVVAGSGPESEKIKHQIETKNLSNRVLVLGRVSDSEKQTLLSNCHLFIQPNIEVENDIEGFGISVIEASAYQLPVIAANLEGLKDAIHNNKNGWLVTSGNSSEFKEKINQVLSNSSELNFTAKKFRKYSKNNFDWNVIIHQYMQLINSV